MRDELLLLVGERAGGYRGAARRKERVERRGARGVQRVHRLVVGALRRAARKVPRHAQHREKDARVAQQLDGVRRVEARKRVVRVDAPEHECAKEELRGARVDDRLPRRARQQLVQLQRRAREVQRRERLGVVLHERGLRARHLVARAHAALVRGLGVRPLVPALAPRRKVRRIHKRAQPPVRTQQAHHVRHRQVREHRKHGAPRHALEQRAPRRVAAPDLHGPRG